MPSGTGLFVASAEGIDHQEFLFTGLACRKATNELLESRHCLEVHRIAHGCYI